MNNCDIIKEVNLIVDDFLSVYHDRDGWADFLIPLETLARRAVISESRIEDALKFLEFTSKKVDPEIVIKILKG